MLANPSAVSSQLDVERPRVPKRVLGTARRLHCCVVPRDGHHSIFVGALVLFPTAVFLVSVVPVGEIFSYVVAGTLVSCALVVLALAVTVDPGILLPTAPDASLQPELISINNVSVECKVCPTCNIVRPPRSSHCAVCNWCVDEYDHHCGVLGSCVAKRTFRFFASFLYFTTLLAAYIVVRTVILLVQFDYGELVKSNDGRWKLVASFGCVVYCGIGGCCVSTQASMYVYLGCTNRTQKECNRLDRSKPHPYDQGGWVINFVQRFCGPLGKSRLTPETPEYV